MPRSPRDLAQRFFHTTYDALTDHERAMLRRFAEGRNVSHNSNKEWDTQLTFGQRLADRVAAFGGSWTFIILFGLVLAGWIVLNSFVLASRGDAFDPYPYILLNLMLSMVAALQAPIIMMSQNRQAAKDRLDAAHDYDVNLKAEVEVASLHDKIDRLQEQQWTALVAMQQEQIRLLTLLLERQGVPLGRGDDVSGTPTA